MERKEPSLVPEWLRGAAGGGSGVAGGAAGAIQFSQQSLHQDGSESPLSPIRRNSPHAIRVKARLGESHSSAHATTSKREYQSSWLRSGSSSVVQSRVNAFGQANFYPSNENLDRDSHLSFDKDRAYGDRNKDRASAFTAFNVKDKEQESISFSTLRHTSAGKALIFGIESPPRPAAQSMGALHRVVANGKKELASELLGEPTDEMHSPSTRAAATPAFMPVTSSDFVYSVKGTKDYHASSDLAASSQHSANNRNFVKEVTQESVISPIFKLAEESTSARNLAPSKVGSPWEKPKLKVMQSVGLGQSLVPKAAQAFSQSSTDPRWAQSQVRHEYSKPVPVVTSTITLDRASLAGVLGVAIHPMATSQTTGAGNFVRKPKQLLDRRSVPILSTPLNSGTDAGLIQRSKEQGADVEDKRVSIQVQNRSDFFNTLRRKAAESAASQSNVVRTDTFSADKTEEGCDKGEIEINLRISSHNGPSKLEERSKAIEDCSIQSWCNDSSISVDMDCGKKGDIPKNDSTLSEVEFVETKSSVDILGNASDVTSNSKEEEEAFLHSLGWKDDAEGEEALTDEEISAFYQQHGDFLATKVRSTSHKQRLDYFVTHPNSEVPVRISSDLTSAAAELAAEVRVLQ